MSNPMTDVTKVRVGALSIFHPVRKIAEMVGYTQPTIRAILKEPEVIEYREELLEIYREAYREAVREFTKEQAKRALGEAHALKMLTDRQLTFPVDFTVEFNDDDIQEMIQNALEYEQWSGGAEHVV